MGRREGEKALMNVALDNNFKVPGDAGFPISGIFEAPRDRQGQDVLRGYLGQARQELAARLVDRLYPEGRAEGGPDKWWMCYQRRKFMGKSL